MQKLVKKTRHYQTLVPVEAYQTEEDQGLEETYFWTKWGAMATAGAMALGASNPVGAAVLAGSAAIELADHYYHDEMVDAFKGILETTFDQAAADARANEALRETARDINDAMGDAIIDWVGGIDSGVDDPHGSGTYYPNE